jgi:lipid-binding SYLF domain-containing protein
MKTMIRLSVLTIMIMAICLVTGFARPAMAKSAEEIDKAVNGALKKLYAKSQAAKDLSKVAKGILVFPSILKGGFLVGAQYGEGALRKEGKTAGYYETVSASYGLQAGIQKFGYAMFFTDEASLDYLNRSDGWEIGVGPNITVVDAGMARSFTTTTGKEGIFVFFFDQKGLMAGLGIQGTKITKITPK